MDKEVQSGRGDCSSKHFFLLLISIVFIVGILVFVFFLGYKAGQRGSGSTEGENLFERPSPFSPSGEDTLDTLVPGFPIQVEGSLSPELYSFIEGNAQRLFWLEDERRLVSYNPVNGAAVRRELEEPGWIVSASSKGALWGVSRNGTVWLYDRDFFLLPGFPVSAGEGVSAPPAVQGNAVILPLESGVLCRIDDTGFVSSIRIPHTGEIMASPAISGSALSVYSKSFFGEIFLVESGIAAGGRWPVSVDGIAYGSPALVSRKNSELYTGFVTQAGVFSVWDRYGNLVPGFPVPLEGVFYLNACASAPADAPVFADVDSGTDMERFWLLSSEGTLFRVGLDGSVLSAAIPELTARSGYITLADYNGDGIDEVFVCGDGPLLYGFTDSLEAIPGFPLEARGVPVFMDVDGDGFPECLAPAPNNTISAWKAD
ncbi:MAG: VCBS repeat-containing protein, partial [Spirochaetaceae bacterium]|nr:VCBS repeat-containing protein [Spirochaetaceae bacterium]